MPTVTPADDGVTAPDMAAMRKQAEALAFQWFYARNFTADANGYAYFLVRPGDFQMRADTMGGLRIRVAMTFERDE